MRPHRLTLTAFGSFPGTETVDFDALSAAGLFLVHGPTGAGKTTILDALCFALYGQVPGQRNSARSLRCDHAPPSVGPSVALEVTIGGAYCASSAPRPGCGPSCGGPGSPRRSPRWCCRSGRGRLARADHAARRGRRPGGRAARDERRSVLPGGDVAAGRFRAVPAG
ncbi:AAA family ATPase [Nonomuraea thailandensis]